MDYDIYKIEFSTYDERFEYIKDNDLIKYIDYYPTSSRNDNPCIRLTGSGLFKFNKVVNKKKNNSLYVIQRFDPKTESVIYVSGNRYTRIVDKATKFDLDSAKIKIKYMNLNSHGDVYHYPWNYREFIY